MATKRGPSKYNLFVKQEMTHGKTMKQAQAAWREYKSLKTEKQVNEVKEELKKEVEKTHKKHNTQIEDAILRNIVELQKVNVDLAVKFDKLAKEISNLLTLFEVTAKSFATSAPLGEYEKDKDFLEKIDKLLDQNKVLAKGLTLMESRLRERVYSGQPAPVEKPAEPTPAQSPIVPRNRPLPRF